MLEGLMKGLALWLNSLFLEIVEYIADSLLEVFNMDMAYFEADVPVAWEIVTIIIAAGWAILIGNLVFHALKTMLSAMSNIPSGPGMLPWLMLVVAIARVARKIDNIVARIGLNVARTGDPISHGGLMYPIMVMRTMG